MNRGSAMRYIAQPTHDGSWWVLDKKANRVVAKGLSEEEARRVAAERNR